VIPSYSTLDPSVQKVAEGTPCFLWFVESTVDVVEIQVPL